MPAIHDPQIRSATPPQRPPPPACIPRRNHSESPTYERPSSASSQRSTDSGRSRHSVQLEESQHRQRRRREQEQHRRRRSGSDIRPAASSSRGRRQRPEITIISAEPMANHPAFADGDKGGYIPPEAPPSYEQAMRSPLPLNPTFTNPAIPDHISEVRRVYPEVQRVARNGPPVGTTAISVPTYESVVTSQTIQQRNTVTSEQRFRTPSIPAVGTVQSPNECTSSPRTRNNSSNATRSTSAHAEATSGNTSLTPRTDRRPAANNTQVRTHASTSSQSSSSRTHHPPSPGAPPSSYRHHRPTLPPKKPVLKPKPRTSVPANPYAHSSIPNCNNNSSKGKPKDNPSASSPCAADQLEQNPTEYTTVTYQAAEERTQHTSTQRTNPDNRMSATTKPPVPMARTNKDVMTLFEGGASNGLPPPLTPGNDASDTSLSGGLLSPLVPSSVPQGGSVRVSQGDMLTPTPAAPLTPTPTSPGNAPLGASGGLPLGGSIGQIAASTPTKSTFTPVSETTGDSSQGTSSSLPPPLLPQGGSRGQMAVLSPTKSAFTPWSEGAGNTPQCASGELPPPLLPQGGSMGQTAALSPTKPILTPATTVPEKTPQTAQINMLEGSILPISAASHISEKNNPPPHIGTTQPGTHPARPPRQPSPQSRKLPAPPRPATGPKRKKSEGPSTSPSILAPSFNVNLMESDFAETGYASINYQKNSGAEGTLTPTKPEAASQIVQVSSPAHPPLGGAMPPLIPSTGGTREQQTQVLTTPLSPNRAGGAAAAENQALGVSMDLLTASKLAYDRFDAGNTANPSLGGSMVPLTPSKPSSDRDEAMFSPTEVSHAGANAANPPLGGSIAGSPKKVQQSPMHGRYSILAPLESTLHQQPLDGRPASDAGLNAAQATGLFATPTTVSVDTPTPVSTTVLTPGTNSGPTPVPRKNGSGTANLTGLTSEPVYAAVAKKRSNISVADGPAVPGGTSSNLANSSHTLLDDLEPSRDDLVSSEIAAVAPALPTTRPPLEDFEDLLSPTEMEAALKERDGTSNASEDRQQNLDDLLDFDPFSPQKADKNEHGVSGNDTTTMASAECHKESVAIPVDAINTPESAGDVKLPHVAQSSLSPAIPPPRTKKKKHSLSGASSDSSLDRPEGPRGPPPIPKTRPAGVEGNAVIFNSAEKREATSPEATLVLRKKDEKDDSFSKKLRRKSGKLKKSIMSVPKKKETNSSPKTKVSEQKEKELIKDGVVKESPHTTAQKQAPPVKQTAKPPRPAGPPQRPANPPSRPTALPTRVPVSPVAKDKTPSPSSATAMVPSQRVPPPKPSQSPKMKPAKPPPPKLVPSRAAPGRPQPIKNSNQNNRVPDLLQWDAPVQNPPQEGTVVPVLASTSHSAPIQNPPQEGTVAPVLAPTSHSAPIQNPPQEGTVATTLAPTSHSNLLEISNAELPKPKPRSNSKPHPADGPQKQRSVPPSRPAPCRPQTKPSRPPPATPTPKKSLAPPSGTSAVVQPKPRTNSGTSVGAADPAPNRTPPVSVPAARARTTSNPKPAASRSSLILQPEAQAKETTLVPVQAISKPELTHRPLYHVESIFDFPGTMDDELAFKAGARFIVISEVSEDWFRGKIGEKVGIFPKNFVKIIEEQRQKQVEILNQPTLSTDLIPPRTKTTGPSERSEGTSKNDVGEDPPRAPYPGDVTYPVSWDEATSKSSTLTESNVEKNTLPVTETDPHETEHDAVMRDPFSYKMESADAILDQISAHQNVAMSFETFSNAASNDQHSVINLDKSQDSANIDAENTTSLPPSSGEVDASTEPHEEAKATKLLRRKSTALFDFAGQDDSELTFKQGDVISVTGTVNDDWLSGELDGHSGIFPAAFVGETRTTESASSVSSGLTNVTHESVLEEPFTSGSSTSSSGGRFVEPTAVATMDYVAQNSDEITFKVNDTLYLLEMVDENRFMVQHDQSGAVGNVPASHVSVIHPLPEGGNKMDWIF